MNNKTDFKYTEKIRMNTNECDFHGQWKPASFFRAITDAASHHSDILGSGTDAMISNGFFWVFSRAKIKFLRYPRFDEEITVRTWPRLIQQKLFFIREAEFLDEQDNLVALATSAWLVVDIEHRSLVPARRLDWMDFPQNPDDFAINEVLEKLVLPEGGEECYRRTVAYSAVDMNGHTNNSRYVEAISDSFDFDRYKTQEIDWMQINFDKEVRPKETMAINCVELPEQDMFYGLSGNNLSNQSRAFEALVKFRPRLTN
jgi:acyl-ACP thioesterase